MITIAQHAPRSPFPCVPGSLEDGRPGEGLVVRPFGLAREDLDVDFFRTPRPHLVTTILHACTLNVNGTAIGPAFFWDLPIGKRIEALVTVAMCGDVDTLPIQLRCCDDDCRQLMEIGLSLEALGQLHQDAGDGGDTEIRVADRTFRLRLPTGKDQLEWLSHSFADESAATKAIIQNLIVNGQAGGEAEISDAWLRPISDAMQRSDPLVSFRLPIHCPHCDQENTYEVDLERLTLDHLRRRQQQTLEAVHRLASRYHWSESQILALPPWRRDRYLALIDKDEAR